MESEIETVNCEQKALDRNMCSFSGHVQHFWHRDGQIQGPHGEMVKQNTSKSFSGEHHPTLDKDLEIISTKCFRCWCWKSTWPYQCGGTWHLQRWHNMFNIKATRSNVSDGRENFAPGGVHLKIWNCRSGGYKVSVNIYWTYKVGFTICWSFNVGVYICTTYKLVVYICTTY